MSKSIRGNILWRIRLLGSVGGLLTGVASAEAHGLGERYDLPLPLGLFLAGAAFAVAVSFLILAMVGRSAAPAGYGGLATRSVALPPWPGSDVLVVAVRAVSAALFVLLVLAGVFGSPDPFKNPLPVSVWVIGWVGIAYVNALLGNVWAYINPWDNLFRLGEWIIGGATRRKPLIAYPRRLGAWPAVAFFFVFAWMELVWPQRDVPFVLASAVVGYSLVTWAGMAVFGRRTWLQNGEALTVAFRLLGRFAVIGHRRDRIVVRPPAAGLLLRSAVSASTTAFVLLLLATVTYDGLLETPVWVGVSEHAIDSRVVDRIADLLGLQPYFVVASLGLVLFPLAFAGCYLLVAKPMAMAASAPGDRVTTSEMARLFVLTLVPIAIGYHLSHYLSYLLIAGQFIIPIASDPFALGWNLFGTKLYLVDFSITNARVVWYTSVVLIVAGHVIAVWLAHAQAQRRLADRSRRLLSQVPLAALMVGYTALSLWILAQPITEPGGG